MKPKTVKITYWIVTGVFALFMLFSGVSGLMPNQQSIDAMAHLGYGVNAILIISLAKVLGALALVQNKYHTLKEWAYAGFTIDILGATASIYLAGDGILMSLFPLVFLAVLFWSYFLDKKVNHHHHAAA